MAVVVYKVLRISICHSVKWPYSASCLSDVESPRVLVGDCADAADSNPISCLDGCEFGMYSICWWSADRNDRVLP